MADDIVRTGARHVNEVRDINRDLIEKSLQMRCLAYLSQVKAQLLTETIFEIDHSKKNLKEMNLDLVQQYELISTQKEELNQAHKDLEQANAALAEKNRELEKVNKLFVDREFRIMELKEQIKKLEDQLTSRDRSR